MRRTAERCFQYSSIWKCGYVEQMRQIMSEQRETALNVLRPVCTRKHCTERDRNLEDVRLKTRNIQCSIWEVYERVFKTLCKTKRRTLLIYFLDQLAEDGSFSASLSCYSDLEEKITAYPWLVRTRAHCYNTFRGWKRNCFWRIDYSDKDRQK